MSARTSIEWTRGDDGSPGTTWNPVRGCTKVSAGCKNCYAERFAERFRGVKGHPFEQGFDVRLVPEALDLPLRWRKPRRIFVNSMSDLFHEDVPDEFLARAFSVMARAKQHTFQVLTKRPERMRRYMVFCENGADEIGGRFPWPNVMLGVSVENQAAADERIPLLLATPAAVRFVSAEPLLGPVDIEPWLPRSALLDPDAFGDDSRAGVDWLIVGGESGPGARPCDVAWIRSLVAQGRAAGVPVFVKQIGPAPYEVRPAEGTPQGVAYALSKLGDVHPQRRWFPDWTLVHQGDVSRWFRYYRPRDRKGGDPAEWPEDLRVREWPRR